MDKYRHLQGQPTEHKITWLVGRIETLRECIEFFPKGGKEHADFQEELSHALDEYEKIRGETH